MNASTLLRLRKPDSRAVASAGLAFSGKDEDTGTGLLYHYFMSALSLTEARRRLFPLVREVNENAEVVQIGSGEDTAFLVPADMWRSISETAYLLRSPTNAARLREAIADSDAKQNRFDVAPDSLAAQ
jgi:antitoxin YefM